MKIIFVNAAWLGILSLGLRRLVHPRAPIAPPRYCALVVAMPSMSSFASSPDDAQATSEREAAFCSTTTKEGGVWREHSR
jgi:hypothetical protein